MDPLLERFAKENAFVAMGNVMQHSFHRKADGKIEYYMTLKAKIFCLSKNFPQDGSVESEISLINEELHRIKSSIFALLEEAL